jgi:GDPmannose 4,6-dehydratase
MTQILDLPSADDFILATGNAHSVAEFAEEAFGQLGLDWRKYVQQDPSLISPRPRNLVGDFSKLNQLTGWQPSVSFPEMIGRLLSAAHAQVSPNTP